MGLISKMARKVARRNAWLAKRLWVIMALDVAWITWGHWRRLELEERLRLRELAIKSKGRPASNLSAKERDEARELLEKLDYAEYGGNLTKALLPFRPVARIVEQSLARTERRDPE